MKEIQMMNSLKRARRVWSCFALTIALALLSSIAARAAETASTPADQLGFQMAIHARTFDRFNLFDAMDKTAALGLKYMSLSASVRLNGTNAISVIKLSDKQIETIKEKAAAKGLKLVNAYVSFPADEAQCRKSFEFARKMGLDTLVGEPEPEALDTVEKLCKEYN